MARDITQLFYQTPPEEIADDEFTNVILPYFRTQRNAMVVAVDAGKRAPTTKRVKNLKPPPAGGLNFDDLLNGLKD